MNLVTLVERLKECEQSMHRIATKAGGEVPYGYKDWRSAYLDTYAHIVKLVEEASTLSRDRDQLAQSHDRFLQLR